MTESEMRAQMESVSMFVDEILSDFNRVDMFCTNRMCGFKLLDTKSSWLVSKA